ncbi:MAG: mannose-6-phosphate isomerase [Cyclobacteriaceae bacterium]|jgi:mannose-6-phosphate isomerase
MSLFKIVGVVQDYAWGGTSFIPKLLGQTPTGDPYAEYWMGAHDKAPSVVTDNGKRLNELITANPTEMLGSLVADHFGRLPFLLKVLDVSDMLSIQVHPSKFEAEKGFKQEDELGVPLTAKNRNYKDDNHKPELMVALGDFWLLHGFKTLVALKATLSNTRELRHLLPVLEAEGYRGLYQLVMEEDVHETNLTLKPLIDRVLPRYKAGLLDKSHPDYWAAKAYLTFCQSGDLDKGIYSVYFFNIVKAKAGEAIFQGAGLPHAYLEGQNMELMANSDNVLRGGLTPKHVDVPELLKHVNFAETIPAILTGELQQNGIERIYKSPAPDFELSKIDLRSDSKYHMTASTFEIMLVLSGEVTAIAQDEVVTLKRGEVLAVTAASKYELSTKSNVQLYKAKCPFNKG